MKKWNTLAAIIAIATLSLIALLKGIDGVLLGSALTLLGALGGYVVAKKT